MNTTTISDLTMAHLAADHRLDAGDTSDLLPGIDPRQAVKTARGIIASDYHDDCPICAEDTGGCEQLEYPQ